LFTIDSIADVKQCPDYEGLKIEPVVGPIPIGRDRESERWGFAHLETTADPAALITERNE
jgi:hypothetical protein